MDKNPEMLDWVDEYSFTLPKGSGPGAEPMVAVFATMRAKPGRASAVKRVLLSAISIVRANEPGCKSYKIMQSPDDPELFRVLEIYADQDALYNHSNNMPYMPKLRSALIEELENGPQIEFLSAVYG